MGALIDRLKLSQSVYGNDIVDYYKSNTIFMMDNYSKSSKDCLSINVSNIQVGCFYFLQYLDQSNWMKFSPIFCVDYRQVNNMIIVLGLNFNFIPLEIRSNLFDKYITEKDIINDVPLSVDFKGMYTELLRWGFEYSIVEYNAIQIKYAHKISLELLPRFLYSSHIKNKYDPNKLMDIWRAKIDKREKRHQEIISSVLSDFYDINKEMSEKYDALSGHIDRIQKSLAKFGK